MVKVNIIDKIRLDAGRLCLDYINTVHDRLEEPLNDYLLNVQDLITWAFRLKLINANTKKALTKVAQEKNQEANSFFTGAIYMRELLYKSFLSIIQQQKIKQSDLDKFNALLPDYFSGLKLLQGDAEFEEGWSFPSDSLYLILAPIVKDAYELMLLGKPERMKACPNCGWLFYDSSKNGKRRWCSMETCGSNVKALKWYHKSKGKA